MPWRYLYHLQHEGVLEALKWLTVTVLKTKAILLFRGHKYLIMYWENSHVIAGGSLTPKV